MNIAWIKKNWAIFAIAMAIIVVGSVVIGLNYLDPVTIGGSRHGVGKLFLYGLLIYIAASVRTVGPTEIGCILVFNKPALDVGPGIVLVPLLICILITEKGTVIQDELPAEPEFIYRGSKDDEFGRTVPKELAEKGYRPPIRVTFSGPEKDGTTVTLRDKSTRFVPENDPYNSRLTAEVVPVISWKIKSLKTFLTNVGDIADARKRMEDACVEVFTAKLAPVTPAVALLRLEEFSQDLGEKLRKLTNKKWGITIESAQIKGIYFSKELNKAVQAVVEADRNKETARLQGEGEGAKIKATINGRTEAYKQMMTDLKVDGSVIIGAETARSIAGEGDKSSQKTIIAGSGGFADLIGAATAIGETLKKGDSK